ncbi:hypothetical protein N8198_09555, partial [Gammaproteobacteria bacterium]|nr:hypothetical protein [Gammaproteobacteria bacterium]
MEQLLSRPEIQSAVVPFIIALLCYLGLQKVTTTAWIWALFAAFLASAALINGLTLTPLTGTRKIILLVIASFLTATLLPRVMPNRNLQRRFTTIVCQIALLWVFWAVLTRMDSASMVLFLVGSISLVLVLEWLFVNVAEHPAQLHGSGVSLLLGVGLSATAAASALLGQLALALAAASGGAFLGWVLCPSAGGRQTIHPITVIPYVLAPALLGVAAVIFARLPWYALIPLASIPFAISLVPQKTESRFLRALLTSLPGLVIAVGVAFYIWR